jgi:hypothetical protein
MESTEANDEEITLAQPTEYDPEKFVKASELRRKERYCPSCDTPRAGFTFSRWLPEEGCDGHPMVEYECADCSFTRKFGVRVA